MEKTYTVTITGDSPLLMHRDNVAFSKKVAEWRKQLENRDVEKGTDEFPSWSWIGNLYHDGKTVGIPSDCIMAMLREAGKKLPKGRRGTFSKGTQAGLMVDGIQFDMLVNGNPVNVAELEPLLAIGKDFNAHAEKAEALGFELDMRRAKVGMSKHIRIRPMFRNWTATGRVVVFDEELSEISAEILQRLFDIGGALVGIGDWRPGGKTPGPFGRFSAVVKKAK